MILIVYMNMILFNYWRRSEDLLKWYQPYTIILILAELIGFSLLMIYLMYWFKIELRFAASFFAIMVTVLSYEMFTDSLKPIIMTFIKKREFKNIRKNENNIKSENENDNTIKDTNTNSSNIDNENNSGGAQNAE